MPNPTISKSAKRVLTGHMTAALFEARAEAAYLRSVGDDYRADGMEATADDYDEAADVIDALVQRLTWEVYPDAVHVEDMREGSA